MKRQNSIETDTDTSPDVRDGELGFALRRAVDSVAGGDEASYRNMAARAVAVTGGAHVNPASWRLAFMAAAAAIVVGVGAAGFGVYGYAGARANALQAAQAIMPEYSGWVPESIGGNADPSGPMAEFVESLWNSGTAVGADVGPLGPVY